VPTYLVPLRNRYGIIGPIPPERLEAEALATAIRNNPLRVAQEDSRAVYAVITNSTYDGLCYNARRVEELLDPSVDRIHFDEAWYAYARFNPMYRDRHAMHGDPKDHTGPTVFATHSTHKLLAALSQASLLHIRDGRSPIPHARFNESYMMQASTSPLYTIIVSNDVTAAMMDGPGGVALTNESIEEAVAFRQTMGRVHKQFKDKGEWFFKTWNADRVKQGKTAKTVAFETSFDSLQLRAMEMMTRARYQNGATLRSSLSPAGAARLDTVLKSYGLTVEQVNGFKPWFVSMLLMQTVMQRAHFEAKYGVDMQLNARAHSANKTIVGLESAEMQLGMFDSLSPEEQEKMVLTSTGPDSSSRTLAKIKDAWMTGDVRVLDDLMNQGLKDVPTLFTKLVVDRNTAWLPKIEQMLKNKDDALVVVGAGHLVGKSGVVEMLRAKGYTVDQI